MGQLVKGSTLSLANTKKVTKQLQYAAINQLIRTFKRYQKLQRPIDQLRWGYEIEHFVLSKDYEPLPVADSLLPRLNSSGTGSWNPEYAAFMVESVPHDPFLLLPPPHSESLGTEVQAAMSRQREKLSQLLKDEYDNALSLTIGALPSVGAVELSTRCPHSLSSRFPTNWINEHPRFATLTRNIVERRGNKAVEISIPIYRDEHTTLSAVEMDAMGFGMGCCCLQTTTELPNFDEACRIFDELVVIGPIALALTASSPVFRGLLSEQDCRWNVLNKAVDDRTEEELQDSSTTSRFSPASLYLSESNVKLNDLDVVFDRQCMHTLQTNSIPGQFSKHYSNIFGREPIIAYDGQDYNEPGDNAEWIDALQSTCWHSVRMKFPTETMSWRVEFRTMEVQPSSFENSAFSIFIEGIILALLECGKKSAIHSFVIPISQVNSNYDVAVKKDAVIDGQFVWRTLPRNTGTVSGQLNGIKNCCCACLGAETAVESEIKACSIDEIVNQDLLPFIRQWAPKFYKQNVEYFDAVGERASGQRFTPAKRIRQIVLEHPDYKKDSIVPSSIMPSIVEEISKVQ